MCVQYQCVCAMLMYMCIAGNAAHGKIRLTITISLKLLFFVGYQTNRVTGCSTSRRTLEALFAGHFQVEKIQYLVKNSA